MTPRRPTAQQIHQFSVEKDYAARLLSASSAERRILYGKLYDAFFSQFPGLRPSLEARQQEVELQFHLIEPFLHQGGTMLEVGAGDGAVARRAIDEKGVRAFVVDASAQALGSARAHARLTSLLSDGPPYPLEAGEISFAYSCHFVEHLDPADLEEHLGEIVRLLRPGGAYVCVTPNRLLGPHDISRYFGTTPCGLHLREYSYRDLARAFRRAGLTSLRALLGVGRAPTIVPLQFVLVLEWLGSRAPRSWRQRAFSWRVLGGRPEPLRILEQVKLLGRAPEL